MSNTFACPSCGGTIEYTENNKEMTCPFCGTAITTPAESIATVIAPTVEDAPAPMDSPESAKTVIQQSHFHNSAEIIDEVKRSLREDDKEAAVRIYSKEFNVPLADARSSVDQMEIDMKHSGKEATPAPEPEPTPPPSPAPAPAPAYQVPSSDVLNTPPSTTTQQSNTSRNWIIGCSVAFVIFCCVCVVLPTVVSLVGNMMNNR